MDIACFGGLPFGPGAYQWRRGCLVRLDEQYRKSVTVIGTASDDQIHPWGTGFLVGMVDPPVTYLVTAAHVVSDKLDAPFDIQFNRKGGAAKPHHIDPPDWVFHETDDTVDVAVHRIDIPEWADATFIPAKQKLLVEETMESKNIGPGSRTYTVGLWKFLKGSGRNEPFVYTGHIGLIPEDCRIPIEPWLPSHGKKRVRIEGYLVEGEPLDGVSGAPVYVRRTLRRTFGKKTDANIEGSLWLLGLQSNAFFGKPGEDYEVISSQPDIKIPRGINVVVPSMKIAEVLDHAVLRAERDALIDADEAARMPEKTSLPSSDENPNHRGDFMRLVGEAAKKSEQED